MMGRVNENIRRGNSSQTVPLRVLIIVASLDILGGQAVQAARLLEGWAGDPLIAAALLPVNPRLPGVLGYLQRVKYVRTVVTSLLYFTTLLVRVPRADVVHIFSASYFSFLLAPLPALLVAKLYGKPALLNYHSGEAEDHLRRSRIAARAISWAERLVVPSQYLVDVFARFGLVAQPIYNTVDLDRFRWRARQPLQPVLLSNRNLEPMYDVATTLRAFALVLRARPEARLLVGGDGSQRLPLRALAEELNLTGVEFVGRIAPDEMPAFYDRADLFLNASRIDNMPLSIIEAFASGLPVVTTAAGGIPYLVADGRTGLLAPCGDEQALAKAVLRLLDEPGLAQRLADAGRDESLRYTWAAVRDQWLQLYRELGRRGVQRGRKSELCEAADGKLGGMKMPEL